ETNERGQFSFAHRPPGKYRVSADTSAGSAMQEFVLGQDEHKEGITLVVSAGQSVRGTVRGLSAAQLQGVRIVVISASAAALVSARPDEQGSYALHGVSPGHATVRASGAGFQLEKQVDVPPDQDVTLDLVIPGGARLSGRVTQGGKPAASKTIRLAPL